MQDANPATSRCLYTEQHDPIVQGCQGDPEHFKKNGNKERSSEAGRHDTFCPLRFRSADACGMPIRPAPHCPPLRSLLWEPSHSTNTSAPTTKRNSRRGRQTEGLYLRRKKKRFMTPTETKLHGDALCFMVKTWATHKTTEALLAVGGGWQLVVSGGWRRLAVGGS